MTNTESDRDSGVLSTPLSFQGSGYYDWASTGLLNRGSAGYYWSLTSNSTMNSRYLRFYSSNLNTQDNYVHGRGFAMRCVELATPHQLRHQILL